MRSVYFIITDKVLEIKQLFVVNDQLNGCGRENAPEARLRGRFMLIKGRRQTGPSVRARAVSSARESA